MRGEGVRMGDMHPVYRYVSPWWLSREDAEDFGLVDLLRDGEHGAWVIEGVHGWERWP